ncbi:MAG: hypothetical protein Q9209_003482 [Squamulea sp. 1 TL-2023]
MSETGFKVIPTPPPQAPILGTDGKVRHSSITQSLTTVACDNPGPMVQAPEAPVKGGGHGPLPEPETTVYGNDMRSIMVGPRAGPPKDSPPMEPIIQDAPKGQRIQTVSNHRKHFLSVIIENQPRRGANFQSLFLARGFLDANLIQELMAYPLALTGFVGFERLLSGYGRINGTAAWSHETGRNGLSFHDMGNQ